MAGDIKFELGVAIDGAMRNLDAFSKKVQKISDDFDDISGRLTSFASVGAAALTGLAAAAAHFADELSDVAQANETTVTNVLALASAMQAVGGSADSAGRLLQTLNNNIDSAASGNTKLANTFAKLGIGINELGTMSQDQIRNTLIKSISEIQDPAERSAKAFEIFGKAAMGMNFKKLAGEIEENKTKYEQYESSIQLAADAFDKMQSIIKDLKIAATVAFEPLFKYIKNLKIDVDTMVTAIRIFGAAIAAAVGASVLAGFAKLIGLVKTLTLVSRANPLIAIASAALGIATAIGMWSGATADVEEATADANKEIDQAEEKTGATKRNVEGLADAYQKQLDTLKQVTQNFNRQLDAIQEKLKLEGDTLKMGEDQKKVAEQIAAIETNKQNTLISLQQKFDALSRDAQERNKTAYESERTAIINNAEVAKKAAEEQIKKNQEYINGIKNLSNVLSVAGDMQVQNFETYQKFLNDTKGTEDRIAAEGRLLEIQKTRQLLIQATAKMSDEDRLKAVTQINNLTSQTKNVTGSYGDYIEKIKEGLRQKVKEGQISQQVYDQIVKGTENVSDAIGKNAQAIAMNNQTIYEQSRLFTTGWDKAFRDYIENATNAGAAAESIFRKFSSGMEDYLVKAIKGMKGSWKEFVASMLEELLRTQLRQTMAQLFNIGKSATGGAGGGFLGGLLGFANGGMIPTNNPVLVGEKGPEIISGAGGRTVIPNSGIGGTSVVTYNISAVDAMSFKQMIAQDPSFIHAIAMQGGKSTPVRR